MLVNCSAPSRANHRCPIQGREPHCVTHLLLARLQDVPCFMLSPAHHSCLDNENGNPRSMPGLATSWVNRELHPNSILMGTYSGAADTSLTITTRGRDVPAGAKALWLVGVWYFSESTGRLKWRQQEGHRQAGSIHLCLNPWLRVSRENPPSDGMYPNRNSVRAPSSCVFHNHKYLIK